MGILLLMLLIFPCPRMVLSCPFLSPQTSHTLSPSLFWADGLASYSTEKIKAIRKELLYPPPFNLPTNRLRYQSECTVLASIPITCDLDVTLSCLFRNHAPIIVISLSYNFSPSLPVLGRSHQCTNNLRNTKSKESLFTSLCLPDFHVFLKLIGIRLLSFAMEEVLINTGDIDVCLWKQLVPFHPLIFNGLKVVAPQSSFFLSPEDMAALNCPSLYFLSPTSQQSRDFRYSCVDVWNPPSQ